MGEAEHQVERHIVGIVEARENGEVSDVSDVDDKAGNGPWFEGSMRSGGEVGNCGRYCWPRTRAGVEMEYSKDN